MATNSPSEINGSDPTVLRQLERQNTALQTRGVSAPPSVSGTTGANTTTTAGAVRNLAPIVSGSETLYPQSTTATSNNAVTINSSINNDTGDVTTVYTTNGRITVNPINQTINQYTSVDSGVSQIVAGNGVTISSTGGSGTGVVTINASTVALGNIVSVNLDGNSANVLHGDGSWSADQTTYGNSNVAAYLPTYTGNIGGNVVTANLFAGNGSSLSAIAGANVSGFVPNANVANTAFAVAAANVTGLGNIATINLTGSSSNVLYGNGVFAAVAGGGNVSELVNGLNSFVLDTDGNVVFEGNGAGQGVDRGVVWDYGANANGVNSELRQDNFGITVRAYTENGGGANGYSAPVNIVTNQGPATKTWTFDGQGNLTVPGNINSISDGGDLGAYITLTPDLGLAKLAGRGAPVNVNYTNTSWISATYTGTQVDFVDAPDLAAFFTNNTFNAGVNQTISINGDEPVPFTGYSIGASNAVTVYTSVTADPDPTTVTSIDFSSQLESYVAVDYDGGELVIGATGLTIMIDNDQTQGPDINLRSGDDILLQAKNKSLGSESEGGDINIYAGDGASDDGLGNTASTGGDIQIEAGQGGDGNSSSGSSGGFTTLRAGSGGQAGATNNAGSGGYVEIRGGNGGGDGGNTALGAGGGYVSITAGGSTQEGVNGAAVTINSGQAGPNALAGNVEISTPASADGPGGTWIFDGYGNLILPNNSNIATIGNVTQFNTCSNGFLGLNSYDAGGNNIASIAINSIDGLVGISTYDPITDSDYHWAFDTTGNLTLPGNTFAVNYANGTPVSIGGGGNTGNVTFDNVTVQGVNGLNLSAGADFTANLAYLQVRAGDVASHIHLDTGNNSAYDLILGDDQNYVQVSSTGNILLSAYDSNTNQYTWTLDYNGNLILAGGNSVIQSIANSSLDILNPNVSTMVLTPDANYSQQALVLDPTAPGHIHLRSPGSNIDQPSANLFLGGEVSSFEVGQSYGAAPNLFIHSNNNTWTFDTDGNLTLPQLTTISDESGVGTTLTVGVPPTVIVISGADFSAVNTTYTKTSATTPTWEPAGYNPATDPYIEFSGGEYGIFAPSFGQALYVNTGTLNKPLTQWNTNPPLGSVAPTGVYTYGASGPDWVFGDDGLLTLPGGNVTIGSVLGGEAILASNTPFGVVSQGNGSTVLQWIDDISNATALSAIYINSPSGNTGDVAVLTGEPGANANIWTFGADGILTVPGDLVAASASPAPSISGFSSVSALEFTNGNSNVTINANSNTWTFDSTGNLIIPGTSGGVIKTVANGAIAIAVIDNGTDNPAQLLSINANGTPTTAISAYANEATIQANINGSIKTWAFTNAGVVTFPVLTYANLSAATTAGRRAFISDANLVAAGNFGNTVSGGGSNTVPVYSDGSVWRIG